MLGAQPVSSLWKKWHAGLPLGETAASLQRVNARGQCCECTWAVLGSCWGSVPGVCAGGEQFGQAGRGQLDFPSLVCIFKGKTKLQISQGCHLNSVRNVTLHPPRAVTQLRRARVCRDPLPAWPELLPGDGTEELGAAWAGLHR